MENTNQNVDTTPLENVAGAATPAVEQTSDNSSVVEPTAQPQEPKEKTFTQKELDKIVQDRVQRLEKEFKKKQPATIEEDVAALKAELERSKKENLLKDYNFQNADFKEFVEFKVSKLVTEEKGFGVCLAEFMEADGKVYLKQEPQAPAITPTPRPQNQNNLLSSEAQYVFDKYGKKI